MSTDKAWEEWGRRDPYYGVITHSRFRRSVLNEEALKDFFHSGQQLVDFVMDVIRAYFDQAFEPKSVLDFGCGVGRVVIPFAALANEVVGLDVSPSMLAEARKNCDQRGINNVRLLESDDQLSALTGSFDLIHSFIVFQHVPLERGRAIFRKLLERLKPGGIGALQFTYAKAQYIGTFGAEPPSSPPSKLAQAGKSVAQLVPGADPVMLMVPYNMNELLFILQSTGMQKLHVEFTDHGGELGVFLFFQAPRT